MPGRVLEGHLFQTCRESLQSLQPPSAMIANWFENKELTLAMAIHVNSWPFGIALGLATPAMLMEATSLEVMMLLTTLFCAAGWLLLFVVDAEPQAASPPSKARGKDVPHCDASTFRKISRTSRSK